MSYAGGSKGGTAAILAAEELLRAQRYESGADHANIEQVKLLFGSTVDRVMGEAALWDEDTAAAALLQARGDLPEAVHLLRAHRSTLPRLAVSEPVDVDDVELLRRIVPAHQNPSGPQLLGATVDYSARILRKPGQPDPLPPTEDLLAEDGAKKTHQRDYPDVPPQRFTAYLREQDRLVERTDETDPDPFDLALHAVTLPAPRSAVLSAMAMAETGGLINMWYRSILGPDGYANEYVTLGEVRHVRTAVRVKHPYTGAPVEVASMRFSECEAIAHLDDRGEDPSRFDVGYGIAVGHNERKVIAMSVMDLAVHRYAGTTEGDKLQQLVMLTTDGLASNGFLEHLKLPHYVTFRSQIDRAEAARQEIDAEDQFALEATSLVMDLEEELEREELV